MPEESITREQAFEQCVAVVRERALFSFMELRSQSGEIQPQPVAFEPLSQWFVGCLVLDAPGYMRMVTKENFEEWNVTFDELFEVGLERLRDSSAPKFQQEDGYFVGCWKDDYDSSRILVADVFTNFPIQGSPVICTPNRLTLLVADSKNEAAVQAMLTRAEYICQNEPRATNPAPLTWKNGEIVDFQASPGSVLFQPVQRAERIAGIIYHEEQKTLIEELHERTGKDNLVASSP